MRTFLVYLAGPIAGLTLDEATNWRDAVRTWWEEDNAVNKMVQIAGLDPLRGKYHLKNAGVIGTGSYDESPLSTGKGVFGRDKYDVHRADALLVNLLGAKRVSIGTVMEIAWAQHAGVPVVVAMEADNVHQHLMLKEAMTYIFPTLEQAAAATYTLVTGQE